MLESEIQRAILSWLSSEGFVHWRCSLGGVRHSGIGRKKNPMKGFPDIAGIGRNGLGRMFVIEVKTKTGRLSPEQEKWRAVLEAKGVIYILARSLDDVQSVLRCYERAAS